MSRSMLFRLLLFMFPALLFFGCGKTSDKSHQNPEKVERLDPYSAPLYPAKEIAPAQDFEIELLNKEPFKLSAEKGTVVLINIWATWCTPCLDETPDLVDLYEKYQEQGFMILGVSLDEQGPSVVNPFIEKFDIPYPIYIDKQDIIIDKYGPIMGIPTTYIIDSKGNLRYFAVGALTKKELEPRIEKLVSE